MSKCDTCDELRTLVEQLKARFAVPIVCMTGSTRFKSTWISENERLTLAGNNVLTVAIWRYYEPDFTAEMGERLDALYKTKIDLCDWLWVLDVRGYIGEGTKEDIEYAQHIGRPVRYLSYEFPDYIEPEEAHHESQ